MTDAIAFHPSPPERAETLSSEQVRRFNRDGFVRPSAMKSAGPSGTPHFMAIKRGRGSAVCFSSERRKVNVPR